MYRNHDGCVHVHVLIFSLSPHRIVLFLMIFWIDLLKSSTVPVKPTLFRMLNILYNRLRNHSLHNKYVRMYTCMYVHITYVYYVYTYMCVWMDGWIYDAQYTLNDIICIAYWSERQLAELISQNDWQN